jgi:hypothetical protein
MSKLNPQKLSVEYRKGVTCTEPIIPRRYTLTHSDITAELFLTIELKFACDKTTSMRDQVLGEWIQKGGDYLFYVYLDIDGQLNQRDTAIRNSAFRRELPLALEAIKYGDQTFFRKYYELNNSPIIVFFISADPHYNRIEKWGSFVDYDIARCG